MTAKRLTRAERKARTRGELLRAAQELFLRQGYHATTLDQVAEHAGYTKGAVYSTFKNKADLFLAVFDETFVEPHLSDFRALFSQCETLEEQVAALAQRPASPTAGQWFLPTIEFCAHAARDPQLRAEYAHRWRRLRNGLIDLLTDHDHNSPDNGGVPSDQRALATLALATGLAYERLVDPDGIPDDLMATGFYAINRAAGDELKQKA
jgi:AcrR family transcriptional regulator